MNRERDLELPDGLVASSFQRALIHKNSVSDTSL
jgi:hypothetical protein